MFNKDSSREAEKLKEQIEKNERKAVIKDAKDGINYYSILNVDINSDERSIKKAFRDLAKQLHPDKFSGLGNGEKQKKEEQFKSINQAHKVLTDPNLRKLYNDHRPKVLPAKPKPPQLNLNIDNIFNLLKLCQKIADFILYMKKFSKDELYFLSEDYKTSAYIALYQSLQASPRNESDIASQLVGYPIKRLDWLEELMRSSQTTLDLSHTDDKNRTLIHKMITGFVSQEDEKAKSWLLLEKILIKNNFNLRLSETLSLCRLFIYNNKTDLLLKIILVNSNENYKIPIKEDFVIKKICDQCNSISQLRQFMEKYSADELNILENNNYDNLNLYAYIYKQLVQGNNDNKSGIAWAMVDLNCWDLLEELISSDNSIDLNYFFPRQNKNFRLDNKSLGHLLIEKKQYPLLQKILEKNNYTFSLPSLFNTCPNIINQFISDKQENILLSINDKIPITNLNAIKVLCDACKPVSQLRQFMEKYTDKELNYLAGEGYMPTGGYAFVYQGLINGNPDKSIPAWTLACINRWDLLEELIQDPQTSLNLDYSPGTSDQTQRAMTIADLLIGRNQNQLFNKLLAKNNYNMNIDNYFLTKLVSCGQEGIIGDFMVRLRNKVNSLYEMYKQLNEVAIDISKLQEHIGKIIQIFHSSYFSSNNNDFKSIYINTMIRTLNILKELYKQWPNEVFNILKSNPNILKNTNSPDLLVSNIHQLSIDKQIDFEIMYLLPKGLEFSTYLVAILSEKKQQNTYDAQSTNHSTFNFYPCVNLNNGESLQPEAKRRKKDGKESSLNMG